MTTPEAYPKLPSDEGRYVEDGVRLAGGLRVGLAGVAMLAHWLDPTVVVGTGGFAWLVLVLFAGYSVSVVLLHAWGSRSIPPGLTPWLDVLWGSLLISFSGGTNSLFFSFFIFAVLVGAFRGGVRSGRALLAAALLAFLAVGFATAPRGATFELDRALMRPIYLLSLGSLILYWAGHETRLRGRLALLRDVMTLSNPRFGIEHTLEMVLQRVRDFYGADSCHLMNLSSQEHKLRLQSVPAGESGGTSLDETSLGGTAELLFHGPDDLAVLYRRGGKLAREVCDVLKDEDSRRTRPAPEHRRLAAIFDAASFLSMPWRFGEPGRTRLYLLSSKRSTFRPSDLRFLRLLLGQLAPALENVRLIERLASDAAEEERRRIAGNIHDSLIQPYIGLRLAVAAVQQRLREGAVTEAAQGLDKVIEVSEGEVHSLRSYVQGLRQGQPGPRATLLESAIQRFCERFSALSGIVVHFRPETAVKLNDRLAAEVFQLVSEALSNIRRHTDASEVLVRLSCAQGCMSLALEDNGSGGRSEFRARSLDERTRALGGRVQRRAGGGRSLLEIQVPL